MVVLAAGVANDVRSAMFTCSLLFSCKGLTQVIGWILLALAVALVNAGTGVTAVYVLLCAGGWTLVLVYLARPLVLWAGRKTGSFESGGPSNSMVMLVVLLTLTSAFVTSIIGIHAIFGGFLAGIVMPNHKSFTQQLTEKIEDLVSVLFLPIVSPQPRFGVNTAEPWSSSTSPSRVSIRTSEALSLPPMRMSC